MRATESRAGGLRPPRRLASWMALLAFGSCAPSPAQAPRRSARRQPTEIRTTFGGYREPISPHLDALAERGVVFERATAPIATTHPSHATMLTGRYPRRHGLRWNGQALPEGIPSVATLLSGRG